MNESTNKIIEESTNDYIQGLLDNYYKQANENKSHTDLFIYFSVVVNFIISLLGIFPIDSVKYPDAVKIPSLLAIVMAALTSIWRYNHPWDKYATTIKAYYNLQDLYDSYKYHSGDFAGKSSVEAKSLLMEGCRKIRGDVNTKSVNDVIESINKHLNKDAKQ